MNVGKRLKSIRVAKKISTYELSEITGISQPVISKLENNNRKADIETLEKICGALGITLIDFFSESGEEMPPEYLRLLQNAKKLTPKQLKILNDVIENF